MQELALDTNGTEVMILPLAGGGTVECGNEAFELSPRASVFDGPADMVYIGTGQSYTLCGEGRFAICGARAKRQLPNRRVVAADVSVELRGTGNCSRQVHNFGTAGVFEADSLIACEVITPGGNWSSYPAHKHDENSPVESALEEIYYFEIAAGPDGFTRLRLPPRVRHPRPPDRGARRGPHRRRRAGTARLPRPVRRRARLPHVLPERDGRSRRRTRLEDRRRPRTRLAARHLGTTRTSTPGCPCIHEECDVVSKASAFKSPHTEPTVRLTVAQATIRFLANQYVERDGERSKFFAGCFGIFGHGNVAGMGQALLQAEVEAAQAGTEPALRYVLGRNEQAMVHTAAAYARQKDRLQTWAVTASIGPGSTNMLTGAALATINRLPVLLLPSDTFATRVSAPVLQELELPHDGDVTVNDAFKPLSRFFDRVWRPEQLPAACSARCGC